MVYTVRNTQIDIVMGDIAEADTEAIVNAANNQLYMGSGVAGALKRKGGSSIEEEAVKKGPIPIGSAAVTSAGNLKAKYVVHAAVMGIDLITDAMKIRNATLSALNATEQIGAKSIAFPALGTGVGGFPLNEAARIMYKAIKEYLESHESPIKVIKFVLYGYEAYNEFLNQAEKDFGFQA